MPPQGKYNPRRWMYVFVESNFFGAVMMGAIFVSLAVFASDDFNRWFIPLTSPWFGGATTVEDYEEQPEYHTGLYDFYICFMFLFEFLCKIWALGCKRFFKSGSTSCRGCTTHKTSRGSCTQVTQRNKIGTVIFSHLRPRAR